MVDTELVEGQEVSPQPSLPWIASLVVVVPLAVTAATAAQAPLWSGRQWLPLRHRRS
jgi:hypothetical protein